MAEKALNRRLMAVLYADVVDYSRLTRQDEVGDYQQVMSVPIRYFSVK